MESLRLLASPLEHELKVHVVSLVATIDEDEQGEQREKKRASTC